MTPKEQVELARLLGEEPPKINGAGHPFRPTDEQRQQVELLVGLGLTLEEIATVIINPGTGKGISTDTLQAHFIKELDEGNAKVKAKVIGSLVKRAISHDHPQGAACGMFIAKCRYGWKEKHAVEVESKAGVLVAPATMTPEEWIAQQQAANDEKKAPGEE